MSSMRFRRWLRWSLIVICSLATVAVAPIGVARWQVGTALNRAESVMSDAAGLKVNQSDFAAVHEFVRKYEDGTTAYEEGDCKPSQCVVVIKADSSVFYDRHDPDARLVRIGEIFGVHPFQFQLRMRISQGRLTGIDETFSTDSEIGAIVAVAMGISAPGPIMLSSCSYRLHPAYLTYRYRKIPSQFILWTDANAAEGLAPSHRMNLQCVTTLRGCQEISEILPAAWEQYQIERPRIEELRKKTTAEANGPPPRWDLQCD